MSADIALRAVVDALDRFGIPHMVVGSMASTAYSAPRATYDIDMVIDPTAEALPGFEAALVAQDFYVGPSPVEALARREPFNAIHPSSGWKVDLIIRKDRPFDRSEFSRRTEGELFGIQVWLATPEDTVLAKLECAKMGGSDRQVADAAAVLTARRETIDNDYLDHWAPTLGVEDLLAKARAAAAD